MKKITIKILSVSAAITLLAGVNGCKKLEDFGNTNINPNTTPLPVTAALLTNVESTLGGFSSQTRGGLYCQYFAETQYTDVSLYALPQIDFDLTYSGSMMDCVNIINQNSNESTKLYAFQSGSNANQIAIAKILKSYILWTVTDRWGDVPNSEAFKGTANLYPKYDKQEDVYKAILKDLKDAANGFDAGPKVKGDVIFDGDPSKWKKWANSLRMLVALRMSKQYPAAGGLAANEFAAAVADGGGSIASNADNVTLSYPGGTYQNPWFVLYDSRNDFAVSNTFTSLLGGLNDTRLGQMATSSVGFPYGLPRDLAVTFGDANTGYAKILQAGRRTEKSPIIITAAAQVLLARAEAAERGWTTENAANLYTQGIAASFDQWGLAVPSAYMNAPAVDYASASTSKLQKIATQRYIATYPDGIQGWNEWRRTGIPVLTPTTYATNASKQIPRRYVYGLRESALNPTSLAAAVAALSGGDTQDSRVWWDKP
jgi:hypothetical protein